MVWKKRGRWHGQVEARPSRPFCSPAPTACLPDRFQGRSSPFIPPGSSTPSTSPCLPPSTQTSARGLAQPCKSGSLPELKFPLQQTVGTAWPGAWLSSLGAPAGIFHHAACPTVVSSDLVSLSSFLLVPPGPPVSSNSTISPGLSRDPELVTSFPTTTPKCASLPIANFCWTGHNFCFYSPRPRHRGHCSTGRFLHGHRKKSPSPTRPGETTRAVHGLPGAPDARTPVYPRFSLAVLFEIANSAQGDIWKADAMTKKTFFLGVGSGGARFPERGAQEEAGGGALLSGQREPPGSPQVTTPRRGPKEGPAGRLENSRRRRRDLCRGRVPPGGARDSRAAAPSLARPVTSASGRGVGAGRPRSPAGRCEGTCNAPHPNRRFLWSGNPAAG